MQSRKRNDGGDAVIAMIQVVLFDIDNTLLDFAACTKAAVRAAFDAFGLAFGDDVLPVFEEINGALWSKLEQGLLTRDEMYALRWSSIFKRLGIQADGFAFDTCFRERLKQSAEPIAGAVELLQDLSGKYCLGVASNGWEIQQRERLTKSGMLPFIRYFFFSETVGAWKPDGAFFDACFRALPCAEKEQVLMVGDSLTADIMGGAAYGFRTCWYNPSGEEEPRSTATYTVHALDELRSIL